MEITPADSTAFRNAIEALKEFLPNARLHISSTGLKINGMDVSHVGFVDYLLSADDCTEIKVPVPTVIGINMAILARTLNSVGGGDKLTLSLSKAQDRLGISISSERMSKKAVYDVPLMDISEAELSLPELTYPADVKAKTGDVAAVIKEVSHFGDAVTLQLDEDGFHISTEGDAGKVRQTLENTEDRDMALTEDSVTATFGTRYVTTIMKAGAPLSSTMQLEFDSEQPLRASFRFGKMSYFVAYLAPRVSTDDS